MKFEDFESDAGIVVLNLSGKIMGGEETTLFHGKLHEYIQAGKNKFVIDLKNVEWMNSVGLGMLISALTTMKNNEGQMRLVNVTENIESLLTITRLVTIFQTHDTIEDAIKSFE